MMMMMMMMMKHAFYFVSDYQNIERYSRSNTDDLPASRLQCAEQARGFPRAAVVEVPLFIIRSLLFFVVCGSACVRVLCVFFCVCVCVCVCVCI